MSDWEKATTRAAVAHITPDYNGWHPDPIKFGPNSVTARNSFDAGANWAREYLAKNLPMQYLAGYYKADEIDKLLGKGEE